MAAVPPVCTSLSWLCVVQCVLGVLECKFLCGIKVRLKCCWQLDGNLLFASISLWLEMREGD